MPDNEDIEKLIHLNEQIESSVGGEIERRTMILGTSYYIYMTNYNHLKGALEHFNRKEVIHDIWLIKNRDKLYLFQTEVIRLLHNYLTSAMSLVEHARIMVNEVHGNKKLLKEYDKKKEAVFVQSLLHHFIKELRNYIIHKGIPCMKTELKHSKFDETNRMFLDLSTLKAWDGWKKKGKEYLNNAKGDINLLDIIVEYSSLVENFYNWFLTRQDELYKEEFKQLEKLKIEHDKLLFKNFPDAF